MVCSWHRMEREELKLARIAVKWPEMLGTYMNKTRRQGKIDLTSMYFIKHAETSYPAP